jgi:hypothetical protein
MSAIASMITAGVAMISISDSVRSDTPEGYRDTAGAGSERSHGGARHQRGGRALGRRWVLGER